MARSAVAVPAAVSKKVDEFFDGESGLPDDRP
jgi:hypothetical protein